MKAGLILENENGEYLLLKISEQSKVLAAKRKCFCRVFMDIECNIPKPSHMYHLKMSPLSSLTGYPHVYQSMGK